MEHGSVEEWTHQVVRCAGGSEDPSVALTTFVKEAGSAASELQSLDTQRQRSLRTTMETRNSCTGR